MVASESRMTEDLKQNLGVGSDKPVVGAQKNNGITTKYIPLIVKQNMDHVTC